MRRPKVKLKPGLPQGLAMAIEARVAACIPMAQGKAEHELMELLRDEFGQLLQFSGEASIARAIALVRGWRMA